MVGLGDLPGGDFFSEAYGVSADGNVVVGQSRGAMGDEAFVWTHAGGMVGLGDLAGGSFGSVASGVSADGGVVVGRASGTSGDEAFVWTHAGGMQSLSDILSGNGVDLTGWQLRQALGVSADGQTIVGEAINPDGFREAYVATIPTVVPVPAAIWLFASALGLMGGMRKGRTRWNTPDLQVREETLHR